MKSTQQYVEEIKVKHNLTLISDYTGAHNVVKFLCPNGHENEATATNLLQRGYKCKECITGRKITSRLEWTDDLILAVQEYFEQGLSTEDIAKKLEVTEAAIHNATTKFNIARTRSMENKPILLNILKEQKRDLLSEYTAQAALVTVKCSNGHVVQQNPGNIIHKGTNCPKCFNTEPSGQEKELREFIQANYTGWIVFNDRSILAGKELDIVLPDIGLAFEYNGNFWHSDLKVDKYYHYNKSNAVEAFGYQLIHINEYVWNTKKDIVKNKILSLITKQSRIGARSTIIKQVSWKDSETFLNNTHIQGAGAPTKYNYGLYYKDNLVALATFRTPRFSNTSDMELVRFSTSINIHGALSKLLKYAHTELKFRSLVTYALRDFSVGKLYERLGFKKCGYTEPNYAYYKKGNQRLSRYQTQKHLLSNILDDFDPNLSESENMLKNRWYKVYDSGNIVFTLEPLTI